MQLTLRYLVKNKILILADEGTGFTEYRPVYRRNLQLYKGIENDLQFKVLNGDQKPVNITEYIPRFQMFDQDKQLIVDREGELVYGNDSTAIPGLFEITIEELDMLNLTPQFLFYTIFLQDIESGKRKITYSSSHFENNGVIELTDDAFPEPKPTKVIEQFTRIQGLMFDDSHWDSEAVYAEPSINNEKSIHTVAIYSDNYEGVVKVQGTLENQIDGSEDWADVKEVFLTGLEKEPVPINVEGVFTYIRIRTEEDPTGKIEKILVRN